MRALVVAGLLGALVACGAASSAETAGRTSLTVSSWPHGLGTAHRETWTLRCSPARGTLPRPGRACRRLSAAGTKPFERVSGTTVCAQIYGGPQVARVVGTVSGKRVSASFNRKNGCEIARWDALAPWLLPVGTAS